ncbi:hypothetical protein DFH07DRAFT_570504 [Mycena maculata]|uniref:Uncharacterized protein n=1 Tax=Mycena maculata TaxID=230809 RepID=A0AAD7K6Q5_9AGAR|nr:hypothetical protein DFH07DRAFT_570504 [Mycena maculata]
MSMNLLRLLLYVVLASLVTQSGDVSFIAVQYRDVLPAFDWGTIAASCTRNAFRTLLSPRIILPVSRLRDRPPNWPHEITPVNVSFPATDPLGVSFFSGRPTLPQPQLRDNNPAAKSFSEVSWAVITDICIILAASGFSGFFIGLSSPAISAI